MALSSSQLSRGVKRPGLPGAVTTENHGDLLSFFLLGRESGAQGQGDRAADHTGGGDEAGFFGDDVHRAAFAAAVASRAPGNFRHEAVDVGAFGDGVAMGTMTAIDQVVVAEQAARADGNRFLTDAEMKQADNLPRSVKRRRLFLEGADQPHAAQQIDDFRGGFNSHGVDEL